MIADLDRFITRMAADAHGFVMRKNVDPRIDPHPFESEFIGLNRILSTLE